MKTILLIHGPNLNLLGQRDHHHYGSLTLLKIEKLVKIEAQKYGFQLKKIQSNYEGALIDFIQKNRLLAAGIIINPGAFTHYSYALHDALVDAGLPTIEVHLSNVQKREPWRRISVTAPACQAVISGKKEKGYIEAVAQLVHFLAQKS